MIEFATADYNISEIKEAAKINKFKTYNEYRIYGLKDEDENPLILVEFNFDLFEGEITDYHRNLLFKFFKSNGMEIKFKNLEDEDEKKIWIGVRRDLRKVIDISSSAIKTIIFFLEGKINLDREFIVPGMPNLVKLGRDKKIVKEKYAKLDN